MKLIISRHAEAENDSPTGSDKDRKLTEKGKNDIIKMSNFIKNTPVSVNRIFFSPYLRTRLTADAYAENLGVGTPTESFDCLAPGNICSNITHDLSRLSNSDTVLIVAHNPEVSYFTSALLGIENIEESLIFSPGTTACILIPRETFQKGKLLWFVSPDFL